MIAKWILVPALLLMICSGLLSMAGAQAGQYDPAALATLVTREQNGLWALLAVAIPHVAVGVWRPRFARQIKD